MRSDLMSRLSVESCPILSSRSNRVPICADLRFKSPKLDAKRIFLQHTTMIDWQRISGFQWDAGNSRKSIDKHDVSQAEAESIFFNQPLLIVEDAGHSPVEQRLHALGKTHGHRLLHLTFTLRDKATLIRVISARPMHRKERNIYAQHEQGPTEIQDRS